MVKERDQSGDEPQRGAAEQGVVRAWNDMLLFVDSQGTVVVHRNVDDSLFPAVAGTSMPFWEALGLETESLDETLDRYPPSRVHEISHGDGHALVLRIIPLVPKSLAPEGGFVVMVTDNRPLEALHETYEERLEHNISALADSVVLFNAFFDTAKDAAFLLDENGVILAANTSAQKQHGRSEQGFAGERAGTLLGGRFRAPFADALKELRPNKSWTKNVVALDGDGEGFPAEATLRKVVFSSYSLFQLLLHDLSLQEELREDLQESREEVREKDIALRQVVRSVEEDRKEMREQLTSQIKKQMLPALERLTTSDVPEVREGYKTVIEDQLVDLAGEGAWELDGDLLRLSPREMEICRLIQMGRSGKEIAELLSISFETLQTHRKNVRRKLGLRGRKTSLFAYLRRKPSLL